MLLAPTRLRSREDATMSIEVLDHQGNLLFTLVPELGWMVEYERDGHVYAQRIEAASADEAMKLAPGRAIQAWRGTSFKYVYAEAPRGTNARVADEPDVGRDDRPKLLTRERSPAARGFLRFAGPMLQLVARSGSAVLTRLPRSVGTMAGCGPRSVC
jgi:hypothetical protein